MSRYADDPRVTDMGGLWEAHAYGRMYGTVVQQGAGTFVAMPDDRPRTEFSSLDEAIEFLAGPPTSAVSAGAALREVEALR